MGDRLYQVLPRIAALIAAVSPIFVTYFFAYSASIHVGHWPSYSNPDPKDLPTLFTPLYLASMYAFIFWLPVSFGLAIHGVFGNDKSARVRRALLPGTVSDLAIFCGLFVYIDPHGVFNWLID